jgi:serine/threonine protein kinase
MSNIERLKELADLHEKGLITREQYDRERDMLLGSGAARAGLEHVPESVGAYNVLGVIGAGGMGTVYKARHRSGEVARRQGGEVAIKVMHPHLANDEQFQERFEREASLGLKLEHPGIVGVYDLVVDGGTLALVMELADGRTLSDVIGQETGPIPWERAWPMFGQILDAVGAAHAAGVIHRDLKPDNVIVAPDGRLKVADFGIAKELGSERTKTATGLGTAGYMAPEQYTEAGSVDQRADIYALGMTLYQMLAGTLPWQPDVSEFEVLQDKASGSVPPPTDFYPDIPPAAVDAVMKAIALDPDGRPASTAAFAALLGRDPASAAPPPVSTPSRPPANSSSSPPPKVGATAASRAAPDPGVLASASPKQGSKAPLIIALSLGCMVICGFGMAGVLATFLFLGASEKEELTWEGDWDYEAATATAAAAPTVTPPTHVDGVAAKIRAQSDGGTSAWDAKVKPIMLKGYDSNSSGWIDSSSEVSAIPCDTWKALDEGVLQQWSYGLRTIYGYEAGYSWVGDAIGFNESIRPTADSYLFACQTMWEAGVPITSGGGLVGSTGGGGGVVAGGTVAGGGGATSAVAQQIRGLSEQGGSSEWDDAVTPIVLKAYDTNKSGQVDTASEVQAVPCDVWKAIDEGVLQKWSYGVRTIYGFDGALYIGDEIGFSGTVRTTADAAIQGCLGSSSTRATQAAPSGGLGSSTGGGASGVAGRIRGLSEEGGSSEWDAAVKPIMLSSYDGDGSGWIDRGSESAAIPCDVWKALDDGVKAKWNYGIRTIYGFEAGYGWIGYAVGFQESVRIQADANLASCMGSGWSSNGGAASTGGGGGGSGSAGSDGVGGQIRGRSETGGTSAWDVEVKKIMVRSYDLNGSGWIDNGAEVASIPCSTWKALDDGCKEQWSYGIRTIYGFEAGYSWVGSAIGFAESIRPTADASLAGCVP